ncbi:tetratricopeptide repeat protein [Engelhardtia mirabilis]|uniref:Tetratricopeptide repeat protein n=1 Tax=Engelhardtia mirabilis TaxID=2528011 RepID=A0A518BPW0_9BACT|nr:Tetratricopeptide repeat protein [Planctomycetes bacterium Pla133]QDV03336.1 Tetratricopeptide repeat protein [Planctomycetes bacterium Pla86]
MLIEALLAALANPVAPNAPACAPFLVASTVTQSAAELVASGRAHLEAGRFAEARADLERAVALDESFATSMWLLRLDVAEGRPEEVLGQLSRLRRDGQRGPDMDYSVGIALAAQCEADIAAGGGGQTGLMLQDAEGKLNAALETDPERYGDAWLVLARVTRNLGDSAGSLTAASRAAERDPSSIEAQELIGRAALGMFAARASEDPRPDEVSAYFDQARTALVHGLELAGEPGDFAGQQRVAGLWNVLGDLHAWGGDLEAARAAYGEALGWDPNAVNIGQIRGTLGEHFISALEFGEERFTARFGERDSRDATLLWWLGWALYATGDRARLDDAEAAFEACVAKWPAYINSWYWLGRIRYDQQDYGGSIAALRENWIAGRADLVASVSADGLDPDRIEYMVGWCAQRDAFDDAAFLSEVLCEVRPQEPRFWNNLGLFLRDSTAQLALTLEDDDELGWSEVQAGYERSFEAYDRALQMVPDSPAFLNDAAVLLHYYLERDYDKALEMYARAKDLAEQQLESGKLSADERPIIEIALRDAKNNSRLLREKIEKERKAAEEADAAGAGSDQG